MLRDQGLIDLERWRSEEAGDLPVPTSVQGLISSRLDRLGARGEAGRPPRVGGRRGLLGRRRGAPGRQDGTPPDDPRPGLGELERRDFVAHQAVSTVAGEDEYAFKHILMRDVAYGQVPKGRRAQLHVRFSDWVTAAGQAPTSSSRSSRGISSRRAGSRGRSPAARSSRRCLRPPRRSRMPPGRAERRESLREARRYYTRALDVLGDDARRHCGRASPAARGHPHDARRAQGGIRGARGRRRGGVGARACGLRVRSVAPARRHRPATGTRSRGARTAGQGAELVAASATPTCRIKVAFMLSALVADFEGQYEQAIEGLRCGIATAEEIDDVALAAEGHLRLARDPEQPRRPRNGAETSCAAA